MAGFQKQFPIKSRDFINAGEASISLQTILKSMGLDPGLVRRAAVCSYEGEMNVVMHGGNGILSVDIKPDELVLEIFDDGPGIEDLELAMEKGYSTANEEHRELGFGAGMGLPNIQTNTDRLTIESEPGKGTTVRMVFFLKNKEEN